MMILACNTLAWEIYLAPKQVVNLEVRGVPISLTIQLTRCAMM
jgi:hypothetical protein